MEHRVKFKIGEIEFEAEGSAEIIERERSVFINTLFPAAIDAIVRTRGEEKATQYIEAIEQPLIISPSEINHEQTNSIPIMSSADDLSRESLSSFINRHGKLSDQDFVLFAAYYDENRNSNLSFTSNSVKQYYIEARRQKYSNIFELLRLLVQKGYIMDDELAENKKPKPYKLTSSGIEYVKTYQPKDSTVEKPRVSKPRKARSKVVSEYAHLSVDDLNSQNYPEVKSLRNFKEKMMMALYIVLSEEKGEWFKLSDVMCILTDIFGESATEKQVEGVFNREKLWFKSENVEGSTKEVKRKLLNGGIDFAKNLLISID